jgi:hypothetical protein
MTPTIVLGEILFQNTIPEQKSNKKELFDPDMLYSPDSTSSNGTTCAIPKTPLYSTSIVISS